ncbi:hypothetical protein [Glycomyces sp. MUSA5-2]|uniref:hypothetical protein n=1 Tax=Glycomyces sp. MUSA5-2 TaxID=2053002 RepID=UPI0030085E5B
MAMSFDTGLQLAGVVVAAAGTYYAFRQYRLAHTTQRERGDADRDGGAVEFFTLKRHPDTTGKVVAWCIIAASAVFGFWSLESSESDMESTIGAVIALAGMLFGARMIDSADDTIGVELNEAGMVVRRNYERPREWRIAWDQVDHVAIVHKYSTERVVVAVLKPNSGFVPGMPQERYSSRDGGYEMCDLREAKPSEEAFLEALRRFSGGDVRK